ncbi:unnamed protein product [Lactuca saligna]|uniref:Protein kinase domain-containing protein n=1 Tax=Lactuca saligna TaxID=75948 RepID=A0AA35ZDY0_LACSI|nr:unnamed protein product [Lactuca saligna]
MESFLEEFQHLKFHLDEIKLATNNFDNNNVIGKGGFGYVYKGVRSQCEGQDVVAFKRLDRRYGQGDPEFWKEILMLSHYKHENLISLLGFCDEDGEKILVYEHASHGSLDIHLNSTTLTWRQRLKICLGAAMGLCYLHDPKGTQQRVIHRDVKSSNILLDENWNAKLSDMGLSKIGPANQRHTFLATNVVGTFGYLDPMYLATSILTKESDVYSFGVVLFEVLCRRPCFDYNNGRLQCFVKWWKASYKQKKLDEIIFQDLKQEMDSRSMETYSNIAYQCLQKSRDERPKMSEVVEKLEMAFRFQEIFEESMVYEEIIKNAVPPLNYRSEEELKMLLTKGIFLNRGKKRFWLNKNGEHCEMISAAECLIPIRTVFEYYYRRTKPRFIASSCRFAVNGHQPLCMEFKTHVKTQFLSRYITYTVNLVFQLKYTNYLGLHYRVVGETKSWTSYLVDKREDGCLMTELYQFTSDNRNVDLEITFLSEEPLIVEGMVFLPLERVEQEVVEDEEVDMQTISDSDTYWEQKLPSDYEDIIKTSKDSVQWTTKKELYYVLCKGFLINDGKQWFSLAKDGKKCYMLPARVVVNKRQWSWRSLPESRFGEVAYDPHGNFSIYCILKMPSPQKTYGAYLVYKLHAYHSGFEFPLKVSYGDHSWYIYLLCPQLPIIRGKEYKNTYNPLKRHKMKGIPKERNDGWMEVQVCEFQSPMEAHVWEFQTSTTSKTILRDRRLPLSVNESVKGLTLQGIEFKLMN